MPSTTSSSVSRLLASSTVITPSLPTFCIALAIISPISRWPLAEMVPTWATSSEDWMALDWRCRSRTTSATARSTPRLRSMGFMPAATALAPSLTMACARTVAVVVPSPASELVFEATSRTICAPMFSNLSSSSISFATVTPSLLILGAPKLFSSTTLRPLGPSVTFTALASMSTPRSILSRASDEKRTSLAAISAHSCRGSCCIGETVGLSGSGEDAHDVGLLHDQEILVVDPDLGAGPLAEQHLVAGLDVERVDLAALVARARADGDDLALLGLLLGRVRDDDAAGRLLLLLEAAHDQAVLQRTEFHAIFLSSAPSGACLFRALALDGG